MKLMINLTVFALETEIVGTEQLPVSGRVQWHQIAPLVDRTFEAWLSLSKRSCAPPTFAFATENGVTHSWDVEEVRRYLDDPKAYRAKTVAFHQLRCMWAGVLYDGYIPNTKSRKLMRLYAYQHNPQLAKTAFNQGYVIRNHMRVKATKAKPSSPTQA